MAETYATPVIREFEGDDRRWWIKWVDGYSTTHRGTGTPSIGVLLSPYEPSRSWVPNAGMEDLRIARVFTGQIPGLKIGNVYRNGKFCDRIPSDYMEFSFDLERDPPTLAFIGQRQDEDAPEWWDSEKYPHRLINKSEYFLGEAFFRSRCFKLKGRELSTGKEATVIVPVQEVIRRYMAPDTPFALSLTTAPWHQNKDKIVDSRKTLIKSPEIWQLVTRKNVRDCDSRYAALIALDERWNASAKRVHSAMMRTSGIALADIGTPFWPGILRLYVQGLVLREEPLRVLCLSIGDTSWPCPKVLIRWRSENWGDKGEVQEMTDKPKPYSAPQKPVALSESEEMPSHSEQDPAAGSGPVHFPADGFSWINPPAEERLKKDVSMIYEDQAYSSDDEPLREGSAGNPFSGQTESAQATFSTNPSRDATRRFTEIIRVLNDLSEQGAISDWQVVPPEYNPTFRGDLQVWTMPLAGKYIGKRVPVRVWSNLTPGVRRAALICSVSVKRKSILLVEIECRPSEAGYRTALLKYEMHPSESGILRLLSKCAEKNGVWPSGAELADLAGAESAITWRHAYAGKSRTTLDAGSLSRAFTKIVSNSAQTGRPNRELAE